MPTRELLKRLLPVTDWRKIPKKDKNKKMVWIYFIDKRTNVRSKKFIKAWFISYQEDENNVLLRFPNSAFFKKYKGKDKIYVDPQSLYMKDLKVMVKGYKKDKKEGKKPKPLSITPPKRKSKSKKKKGGKKILLNF